MSLLTQQRLESRGLLSYRLPAHCGDMILSDCRYLMQPPHPRKLHVHPPAPPAVQICTADHGQFYSRDYHHLAFCSKASFWSRADHLDHGSNLDHHGSNLHNLHHLHSSHASNRISCFFAGLAARCRAMRPHSKDGGNVSEHIQGAA